jgi:hypothetical protein
MHVLYSYQRQCIHPITFNTTMHQPAPLQCSIAMLSATASRYGRCTGSC